MSAFTVTSWSSMHVLRESECANDNGHVITLIADRFGLEGRPTVRLMQSLWGGNMYVSQEMSVAQARALAAELLASADALDAVTAKKGGAA